MEIMSREEKFKATKLPELKAQLQNRGITVNSLPQTRTRSYCLCRRRRFSLLFQVSEAEDHLNLSRRLKVHDIQLPDPFKMNVLNDFKHSRALFYIFNHLIYHSSKYDKQSLAAAYKYLLHI
ncbi:Hypothetical predicted protein, partial [Paramuricea clavata]